ncbi:MAG TPA: 50S ribosomal protein L6 [Phycisphaerales bacterium]|nr:50S ribosomal protein L6 [Phycisphaerales bacterium]
MSRIGKQPLQVPSGVKVNLDPKTRTINIDGSKGKLSFKYRPEVTVNWAQNENRITCSIPKEQMENVTYLELWGTTRARIKGMIEGVTQGFTKKLEVNGVGWGAKLQGKTLELAVGFCNPVKITVPMSVQVAVEQNVVTVTGADKQAVGQFAAEVRAARPPEPYNGKGVKYADEVIQRKQGKVFGT